MKNLLFWNQAVGFTIAELADLFSVSPSFLARLIRGKKSLPVQIIRKMIDPLFEHFENEDLELGLKKWHNPNPEIRAEKWGIKLIALQLKLDKALKNKTLQENQYRKNGFILFQFKRKESTWAGRTDHVAKWWDFKNSAASRNQKKLTLLDQEAMELEILSLQTQIEKIKKFLLER